MEKCANRPFVGPAGKLLDKAMRLSGVPRAAALVTNVVNVQPPGDKWEAHNRDQVRQGVLELHELLGAAPRRLIVTLGEQAFWAVVKRDPWYKPNEGEGSVTERRGYVYASEYGPVLCMIHPAFVVRAWVPNWALLCWDWQKAARLLAGGADTTVRRERYVATVEEAERYEAEAAGAALLAVDTETDGEHAERVACVAFATSAEEGVCFPLTEWTRPYVARLLASPVPKVLQNAQFDLTVLEGRERLPVANVAFDTMFEWHAAEPLLAGKQEGKAGKRTEKSLRFLASLLTDEPWFKNYQFKDQVERWTLCATDARITFQCHQALQVRYATLA